MRKCILFLALFKGIQIRTPVIANIYIYIYTLDSRQTIAPAEGEGVVITCKTIAAAIIASAAADVVVVVAPLTVITNVAAVHGRRAKPVIPCQTFTSLPLTCPGQTTATMWEDRHDAGRIKLTKKINRKRIINTGAAPGDPTMGRLIDFGIKRNFGKLIRIHTHICPRARLLCGKQCDNGFGRPLTVSLPRTLGKKNKKIRRG